MENSSANMQYITTTTTSTVVVSIPREATSTCDSKRTLFALSSNVLYYLKRKINFGNDPRKVIHSLKVGFALVLVSLFYFVDTLYKQVGENAMWAVMTVVVIFEFSAGATLSKGLNRGIGTILGGGLGCLTAIVAEKVGGTGKNIAVGITVFIFGVLASYCRLVPSFKKKFDYGAMIFILTFNLIAVSGLQGEKVIDLALDRLLTIGIGFVICIFTSLVIFPVWASDELHSSFASKFDRLASSIERCTEEYFKQTDEKDDSTTVNFDGYLSVLHSKSKDEILANFARWEPWHGKFGFFYPWDKYLHVGDLLNELAASIFSLKECVHSPRQPLSTPARLPLKEPCKAVASFVSSTLRELGESIKNMRIMIRQGGATAAKLQKMKVELSGAMSVSDVAKLDKTVDGLAMASFVFSLMEILDKVEKLVKEVENLGDEAGFGHGGSGHVCNKGRKNKLLSLLCL
ncbi:hypothetical protein Scep_030431 [Stephania cephalantha]|uniref:Aluminum-activated malate transporter n=1 Tax=Stephania cephalantha TaxID=152367 RepID=A0AAP0E2F6_9MAGN